MRRIGLLSLARFSVEALAAMVLFVSPATAGYVDCMLCHVDPDPTSGAQDYLEYFVDRERQHPTNTPYPRTNDQYRLTLSQVGDITFFDANGNGVVDPEEIQLFGTDARVQCSSCHREHGDSPPPPNPDMYLRIANAGSSLCQICHDM